MVGSDDPSDPATCLWHPRSWHLRKRYLPCSQGAWRCPWGSARSPAPAATLARRTTQLAGGGDGYQERGCEVACYGRVDADDRQSGVATRAFRVRRFCWSALSVRLRFRCDPLDSIPEGPGGSSCYIIQQDIPRSYGRHCRKFYATQKAPRRRNRYALSTIFLPWYPLRSLEDLTGAEKPGATNYRGSYLVRAIHKVNVTFSRGGKLHSAFGYPVASHYCDVLRFVSQRCYYNQPEYRQWDQM